MVAAIFARELRLQWAAGGGATALVFFLAVVATIPFAVGPDLALLRRIGPGILWVGALLSTLLALDRLFQADRDDGTLDLLLLSPLPLAVTVLVKCAALWCAACLPLIAASPALALLLALEPLAMLTLAASLLLGTPALVFLGAVAAAVAVSLPRGGLLVSVLVLPLAVPVLVFGVLAAQSGSPSSAIAFSSPAALLAALSLALGVAGPLLAAIALRSATD